MNLLTSYLYKLLAFLCLKIHSLKTLNFCKILEEELNFFLYLKKKVKITLFFLRAKISRLHSKTSCESIERACFLQYIRKAQKFHDCVGVCPLSLSVFPLFLFSLLLCTNTDENEGKLLACLLVR